jgi:hypothetical protein
MNPVGTYIMSLGDSIEISEEFIKVLEAVYRELQEHDWEYHHKTDPKVKADFENLISEAKDNFVKVEE